MSERPESVSSSDSGNSNRLQIIIPTTPVPIPVETAQKLLCHGSSASSLPSSSSLSQSNADSFYRKPPPISIQPFKKDIAAKIGTAEGGRSNLAAGQKRVLIASGKAPNVPKNDKPTKSKNFFTGPPPLILMGPSCSVASTNRKSSLPAKSSSGQQSFASPISNNFGSAPVLYPTSTAGACVLPQFNPANNAFVQQANSQQTIIVDPYGQAVGFLPSLMSHYPSLTCGGNYFSIPALHSTAATTGNGKESKTNKANGSSSQQGKNNASEERRSSVDGDLNSLANTAGPSSDLHSPPAASSANTHNSTHPSMFITYRQQLPNAVPQSGGIFGPHSPTMMNFPNFGCYPFNPRFSPTVVVRTPQGQIVGLQIPTIGNGPSSVFPFASPIPAAHQPNGQATLKSPNAKSRSHNAGASLSTSVMSPFSSPQRASASGSQAAVETPVLPRSTFGGPTPILPKPSTSSASKIYAASPNSAKRNVALLPTHASPKTQAHPSTGGKSGTKPSPQMPPTQRFAGERSELVLSQRLQSVVIDNSSLVKANRSACGNDGNDNSSTAASSRSDLSSSQLSKFISDSPPSVPSVSSVDEKDKLDTGAFYANAGHSGGCSSTGLLSSAFPSSILPSTPLGGSSSRISHSSTGVCSLAQGSVKKEQLGLLENASVSGERPQDEEDEEMDEESPPLLTEGEAAAPNTHLMQDTNCSNASTPLPGLAAVASSSNGRRLLSRRLLETCSDEYGPDDEIDAHTMFMQEVERNSVGRPNLLTHVIDGFIIQESTEPFAVSPFPFDDFVTEAMLELAAPPELEPEVSSCADEEENAMPPLACEYCGKSTAESAYLKHPEFCSKTCASQANKKDSSVSSSSMVADDVVNKAEPSASTSVEMEQSAAFCIGNSPPPLKRLKQAVSPTSPEAQSSAGLCTSLAVHSIGGDVPTHSNSQSQIEPESPPPVTVTKNPSQWNVDDVHTFLLSMGSSMSEYAQLFRLQEIDGTALLLLQEQHLMTMGIKLGPAIKICAAVKALKAFRS